MAKSLQKSNSFSDFIINLFASRKFQIIIIVWFIFQATFMALSTAKGIPPDEGNHYRSIIIYANNGLDPFIEGQPEDAWRLQGATRSPSYMYHYLMSFPYRLLPSSFSDETKVIVLRLFNMWFSVAGILVFTRLLPLVSKKPYLNNLVLLVLTNTLMFPFIAGALNYDNLVFLVSTTAIYYFVKLMHFFSVVDLVKLGVALLFGALVKFTILPLGLMLVLILIFNYRKSLKDLLSQSKRQLLAYSSIGIIALVLVGTGFLGLFIERYGVNYVRYGTHKPQCDQVLSYEQCLHSALFKRNLKFRDNTIKSYIPTPMYVLDWANAIKKNTYGILGHKRTNPTLLINYGSVLFWGLALIAILTKFSKREVIINYLLLVAIIYTSFLLVFNFFLFEKSGRDLARQGRYLFPVLGLFYLGGLHYIDRLLQATTLKAAMFLIIALLFVSGSLPSYIYSTNQAWHTDLMLSINTELRNFLHILIP